MFQDVDDLPLEAETPDELTEELGAVVLEAQGLRVEPLILCDPTHEWEALEYPDLHINGKEFSPEFRDLVYASTDSYLWFNTLRLPVTLTPPATNIHGLPYVTYGDWLAEQLAQESRAYEQDRNDQRYAGCP